MAVFKREETVTRRGVSFSRAEREKERKRESLKSTFDAGWNRDTEELTSHLDRATNYLSNRRVVRLNKNQERKRGREKK